MAEKNNADDVIRLDDVAAGYDGKAILEHVSFSVKRGEILFILGGSGCGKSTLMRHMIGLNPVIAGRVFIAGEDFSSAAGEARSALIRHFGVMYQSGALFGTMSLLENVMLPLEEFTALPQELRELTARMKLEQVGLLDRAHLMPAEISGGMKKRGAIARAMALDPEILFFDEPSAGLDPITSAELDRLIFDLSRTFGRTVVVISHELASIEAIADRVVFLDRAARGVLDIGTPRELKTGSSHPAVRAFFNRSVQSA